ncbi:hypothetical protein ACFQY7_49045 [Actinomadura luteofluorescens]|uniref:hypothetical protein n=1 Tax=Actinomadura luteofluorescens TaxID=46163 RepID=UPI0036330A88
MLNLFSSATAYFSSRILRAAETSRASWRSASVSAWVSSRFFTYCWVMPEPPCVTWPLLRLLASARRVPCASMAPCS